tara:strand:- start:4666 stop:6516 length:1851 start_codon:yes stop_codon:yes gene_type:complete
MDSFYRILGFGKNYSAAAWAAVLFYVVYTLFQLAGIGMIIPVMDIILNNGSQFELTQDGSNQLTGLQDYINNIVNQGILTFGSYGILWRACLISFGLFLAKNIFRYAALWQMASLRGGITAKLRQSLHHKILKISPGKLSENRKGDLLARASSDVTEIEYAVLAGLEIIVREPLVIIGSLIILFSMSFSLTIFVLLIASIAAFLLQLVSKKLKRKSNLAQSKLGMVLSALDESISGLRVIQAYQAESRQRRHFENNNNQAEKTQISVFRRRDLASPISEIIGISTLLLILLYGGAQSLAGHGMTGAALIGFALFFYQLIPSFKSISNGLYNVQKGSAAAERLFEILDKEEDIKDPNNIIKGQSLKNGIDSIEWDGVSLKYPDANGFALENFSATINRGETVAIVGPSGGGKTSLINLLIRAIDPSSGSVRLNGVPVWHQQEPSWPMHEVRSVFSLVTQDSIVFHTTVSENISLGDPNPDKNRIIEAAISSQSKSFIDELPDRFDCVLKEGGSSLSGGQRQRIALARAIYRNSNVLLLDEATSALDTENESRIQKALDSASANRTTIIVAHRLATVQKADRILVVDQGRLIESGSHSELILKSGLYSQLVKTQSFVD